MKMGCDKQRVGAWRRAWISFWIATGVAGISPVLWGEAATLPEDPGKFHIFLLMGQSNMEGGQSVDGEMDTESDPRILKLNKSGFWAVAKDPITNNYSKAVGPGFQFAKELIAEDPDITVGLIPLAVGGTPIAFWSKPGMQYQTVLYYANRAHQDGTLKGILWHQGESDAGSWVLADSYDRKLMRLIDDLRLDLRDAYLPFLVGGITTDAELIKKNQLRKRVWDRQKWVGSTFFRAAYVSSVDIPYIEDDPIHFSSEGQRQMGKRYAREYLRLEGHWTAKGKQWLDAEAIDNGDGWKYHPELGIYHDAHWPILKHAQLGWLQVDIDPDHVIRLDSPFIGKFRIMQNDGFENAIYIFTENTEDPDNPKYGIPFYVSLLREPGDAFAFYDHSINAYLDRLPGMTVVQDAWDLNSLVEAEFYQTQVAAQELRNQIAAVDSDSFYWSNMRRLVDEVVYHRNYTNTIGWEGYHFARQNAIPFRQFWMDKFFERLFYIDDYVVQAQHEFQAATDALLTR